MTLPFYLGLVALLGGVMGISAGVLGVGGGIFIVPVLYVLFGSGGWSGVEVAAHHEAAVAHATSLLVILFAALSGLREFQRTGAVSWRVVVPLGVAAVASALVGARAAAGLPSPLLKALFGVFLVASGIRLAGRGRDGWDGTGPGSTGEEGSLGAWGAAAGGAAVGFLSALLGVGGGIVAIPILVHFARMPVHRVVPASVGIISFAAPAGVLGYVLAGREVSGLPWGSLGYVHLPTALAMLPGAVLLAPVGARLNRRLDARTLERVFAVLLVVLGAALAVVHGARLRGG